MSTILWIGSGLRYIILAACLWMLFCMFKGRKHLNKDSLQRGLHVLWKKKILVIALGVIFCGAFCGTEYYINSRLPVLQIKLNYEEASKGQNPNGTRFNSSRILSDQLLNEVIQRGNFSITSEELSRCLYLSSGFDTRPVSSTDLKVATEYWVAPSRRILSYGIDGRELMNILGDVYYESFLEEYTENDSILQLSFEDMERWDYLDITSYLRVEATKLRHYMDNYSAKDSSYRDSESGESFASLREKIDNFINVDLERYNSYVLQNGLSKDGQEYMNQMDYENRLLQVDRERNMAAYNVRLEAIDLYDSQMARIVLVPTSDQSEEFYMSRTKIGVDYFADEADLALQTATELQVEMDNNTYARNQLAAAAAEENAYTMVETMLDEMKAQLTLLSEQALRLTDTYIKERRDGYLQLGLMTRTASDLADVRNGIFGAVAFMALLGGGLVMKQARKAER